MTIGVVVASLLALVLVGVARMPLAAADSGLLTPATVTTFAGSGQNVTTPGNRLGASFWYPGGVAVVDGYAYVGAGASIQKVDLSTGDVSTFAGTASSQSCADSSDGADARFIEVNDIVASGSDLYVTDNCGVREVDISTGATTTLVSGGGHSGVAIGSDGSLYFLDGADVYQYVPSTGSVSVYATLPAPSQIDVQGISSAGSSLWVTVESYDESDLYRVAVGSSPTVTTVDHQTNLYEPSFDGPVVADGSDVYFVSNGSETGNTPGGTQSQIFVYDESSGLVSLVAGASGAGYQDGTGSDAWFSDITGLAYDGSSLWIVDGGNRRLRQATEGVAPQSSQPPAYGTTSTISTGIVSTLVGNGKSASTGGTGQQASLDYPQSVISVNGALYIGTLNGVWKLNETTGALTSFVGSEDGCADSTEPTMAQLITGAAITSDGTYLYLSDNCGIRRISLATGATSTVTRQLNGVVSLTTGPDGNLYAVSGDNPLDVYQVVPSTGVVSTYATFAADNQNDAGGITADANALWVSSQNYVPPPNPYDETGSWQSDIWKIPFSQAPQPSLVEQVALGNQWSGFGNAVSAGQFLYVSGGNNVYRYDKQSGQLLSIAGGPTAGYGDGVGSEAQFSGIDGLATVGDSSLVVADRGNNRVREISQAPAGLTSTSGLFVGGSNPSVVCSCETGQMRSDTHSDPVDALTGDFNHSFTDLVTPGRGEFLDLSRTYSSDPVSVGVEGPFGYGWADSYGLSVVVSGSTVTVVQENGSRVSFTGSSGVLAPVVPGTLASLTVNSDGSFTFVRHDGETFSFDSSGRLRGEADRNGEVTSVSYPDADTEVITDPAGRSITLRSSGGLVVSATASGSPARSVEYGYDSAGDLTSVTDVDGGVTTFTYDGDHRMLSMRSARFYGDSSTTPAPVVTNTYDSSGRVVSQSDQLGRTTSFDYTSVPGSTLITDPVGNVTEDTFTDGLLTSQTVGYGTASAATTTYGYDPSTAGVSEIQAPGGQITQYFYDQDGNVTAKVDPLGRVTTWTYNGLDEVTSETGPGSYGGQQVTTSYSYDEPAYSSGGSGNLTTVSTPVLSGTGVSEGTRVVHYLHGDSAHPGDVTAMVDPDGNTWTYTYDDFGDKVSATAPPVGDVAGEPAGYRAVTRWAYDTDTGWVTSVLSSVFTAAHPDATSCSAPAAGCSTFAYDPAGQVVSSTDGNGHTTTDTYDPDGNRTTVTDPNGNETVTVYDPAGEPVSVTQAAGTAQAATTATSYTADGQVATVTDPAGDVTTDTYNTVGELASSTDPDGRTTTYAYDSDGNLVAEGQPGVTGCNPASAADGCTVYSYDLDNELTGVAYHDPATSAGPGTPDITAVSYSPDGQKLSETQGSGSAAQTQSWVYDSAGELTSSTDINGATVTYAYDLAGNQTAIGYPNTAGTVTTGYDPAGRPDTLTDWDGNQTSFDYTPDGNLADQTSPTTSGAAVVDTASYDNAGNPIGDTVSTGGTTLASFTATYDPDNQLSSTTSTGIGADPVTYAYTSLNQLSSATDTAASTTSTYSYDQADNPTGLPGATSQAFDPAGQLCWSAPTPSPASSGTGCTSPPSGATTYNYNPRGDLTTITDPAGTATTLTYDQADRLTSYNTTSTDTYNPDGLRATETTPAGTTLTFSYDQSGTVPQLLTDSTNDYIWGPAGLLEQINQTTGTIDWAHQDPQGNTRLLTDPTGTTVGTATYTPYGTPTTTGTTTPLGWGDGYSDPTGLVYLINRYYNPTTAQFLTIDPALSLTGSAYGYTNNNPTNATDPTGMCVEILWACVGGGSQTSSIGFRWDPGAGANALVNIGRGASFGLSDTVANWIEPGASCTVAQNSIDQAIGGIATGIATGTAGLESADAEAALSRAPGAGEGWVSRVADNGKGVVWQEPGAVGNANSLRIMEPTTQYPNGYVRFYNEYGQPIGLDGNPGPNSATHVPLNPDSTYALPKGW